MKSAPVNCCLVFFLSLFSVSNVWSQPPRKYQKIQSKRLVVENKNQNKHVLFERSENAATIIREMMDAPDRGIPQSILDRAMCVAVFPSVKKGGFGIGGQWGRGVASCRFENKGWSTPAFLNLSGGSFGFQIGAEVADVILIINNRSGMNSLLKSKVGIGAGAEATAGIFGRGAGVGTDVMLGSGTFSYSRSRGLFAGLELKGAVITSDTKANEIMYGRRHTHEMLSSEKIANDPLVRTYPQALAEVSPMKAIYVRVREVRK